jgi:hypothetical protein
MARAGAKGGGAGSLSGRGARLREERSQPPVAAATIGDADRRTAALLLVAAARLHASAASSARPGAAGAEGRAAAPVAPAAVAGPARGARAGGRRVGLSAGARGPRG